MYHILLEGNPLGREFLFYKARKDLLEKTKGHYPAPLVALNLIEETCALPLNQGLDKEIETFLQSRETAFGPSKYLIQIFFTSENLKKNPGLPEGVKPSKVNNAGVLGAGTMGAVLLVI